MNLEAFAGAGGDAFDGEVGAVRDGDGDDVVALGGFPEQWPAVDEDAVGGAELGLIERVRCVAAGGAGGELIVFQTIGVAVEYKLAIGAGYFEASAAEMRGPGGAVDRDSAEDALDEGEPDEDEDREG